jgi:hypothetical protein
VKTEKETRIATPQSRTDMNCEQLFYKTWKQRKKELTNLSTQTAVLFISLDAIHLYGHVFFHMNVKFQFIDSVIIAENTYINLRHQRQNVKNVVVVSPRQRNKKLGKALTKQLPELLHNLGRKMFASLTQIFSIIWFLAQLNKKAQKVINDLDSEERPIKLSKCVFVTEGLMDKNRLKTSLAAAHKLWKRRKIIFIFLIFIFLGFQIDCLCAKKTVELRMDWGLWGSYVIEIFGKVILRRQRRLKNRFRVLELL